MSMAAPQGPRAIDWIMIATLGLVWGSTFLAIEIALRGITPFWLAAARITFAATLLGTIWRLHGGALFERPPDARAKGQLFIASALSTAVPYTLLAWGQQFVTSGFAGVSMAAVALMVLPIAHVFVPGERMTPRRTIGFVIGFVGVAILIGEQALASTGRDLELWGRLACLGAAACYAISSVTFRLLPRIDTIGLTTVSLIIGAVFVVAAAWAVEGAPPMPDRQTLVVLVVLGLIPTAASSLLRVSVIQNAGPTFMSLTNYQVPIWSVLMGALFLREPLPPSLLTALLLILVGLGLSQWNSLRRLFGLA